VFEADPHTGRSRVAEVSAAVDHELTEAGLAQHRRHDVDQVALARRSYIDHEGALREDRGAVPDDIPGPDRPPPNVRLFADHLGRGCERLRPVVAEELEVASDERVRGATGRYVEPVVQVEEGDSVQGEVEAATVGGRGDLCDQRIRSEPRVGGIEAIDPLEDAPAQPLAQGLGGLDLPPSPDGIEPEGEPSPAAAAPPDARPLPR
jgi:hypothetical protein